MKITAAIQSFINHLTIVKKAPKTIKYYTENLGYFLKFCSSQNIVLMAHINYDTIDNFTLYMQKNYNRNNTSINTSLRALRTFINFSFTRKYINEKYHITMLPTTKYIKPTYEDADLLLMLNSPSSSNYYEWRRYAMVATLCSLGIRASTLSDILVSDINFKNNTIQLNNTKAHREYTLPLESELIAILKQYIKQCRKGSWEYLFSTKEGEKLSENAMYNALKRFANRKGANWGGIHLFRHTFAYNYIDEGGDTARLQGILNHSDIRTTQTYLNQDVSLIKSNYEKFSTLGRLTKERLDS